MVGVVVAFTSVTAWGHPHPGGRTHGHEHEHEHDASVPLQPRGSADADDSVIYDDDGDEIVILDDDGDEIMMLDDDWAEHEGDEDAPPTAAEILAQTGADSKRWDPPATRRYMSREGVNDPFPDKPPRARPVDAVVLMGLGAGFAAASTITARSVLLPDCDNQNDLNTCTVPDAGDIGLRSGRLFGTIGFSIGGAAFGAFGAREIGQLLQQGTRLPLEKRRRIAIGLGTTSMLAGLTGIAVGSSMVGLGSVRSLRIANSFDPATTQLSPEELALADEALGEVKNARVGLMVLVASPMFLASGISLLVNRPRLERLSITPTASLTNFGVQATVKF